MNKDKNVILLIGVPASGKSTFRDRLVEKRGRFVHISTDDIIEEVAAKSGRTYDECFQEAIDTATRQTNLAFRQALNDGEPLIVIDRTNLTPKSRKQWVKAALNKDYRVTAVVFRKPVTSEQVAEWNRRLRNRPGKTIPQNVLDSMMTSFSVPTMDEGFSGITFIDSW